ncbi:uncharacterized protein LOC115474267 [Microcaecilia unicolor]|uniref:Uncharacterized protein LOC115474267 n=1 Tax=Microcaecilia unicolor TaxID=1415580 RepID=A0A6P7YQW0_9AMPH|nr:uncharacterized protein LOC115474267 [Microcaecilia unicolor]XP_030065524.1 uncharacterized protein LOC115474267 [Microcaecilia unicolor]
MEKLEAFLTLEGEAISDLSTPELEELLQLLSEKVHEDKATLCSLKNELLKLEKDVTQRAAERQFYVLLAAQLTDLDQTLREEHGTSEQLRELLEELERLQRGCLQDDKCQAGKEADELQELEATLAPLQQRKDVLRGEKEDLLKSLEAYRAELAEIQAQQSSADEELLGLQREQSERESDTSQKRAADILLDDCIRQLGVLKIFTEKK